MIPIEALREWHKGVHDFLKKEFPGLRIVCKNKVNAGKTRWEFETVFWPPNKKPGVIGGFFTFANLQDDQEVVLTMMGQYPHSLKTKIKEYLEADIHNWES